MNKYRSLYNTTLSLIINLLLVMGCFILCRVIFLIENLKAFSDLSAGRIWRMFEGGFLFDTSAILYTNLLYIFLMLIPLHYKENVIYQKITKGIFVTTNLIVIIMNLMDTVYFQYTHRRTTASVFSEFKNEGNLGGIIGTELLNHWYLTLFAIAFGYALFKLYRKPKPVKVERMPVYYTVHLLTLGLGVYLCIGGMRGGFTGMVRPITISNANKYVDRPMETGIVLNTPFSIFRTFGKTSFAIPQYFDKEKMEALYTPVHMPADSVQFRPLNVVVFILESFSKENSGFLNEELDNGTYKGYMPFLDSLMAEGLTFKYSFSNGMKSIDGMPSVLSGIPMFIEPFFLTPSSLNTVSSIGGELGKKDITPLSSTGRTMALWDLKLLHVRQGTPITLVVRNIMRLIRVTRILTGIGEFGMRNSSSSLAILYPVFSSLLQLRCSAFLPTIRLQFRQNTKAFFRKGIKLFVSASDTRIML